MRAQDVGVSLSVGPAYQESVVSWLSLCCSLLNPPLVSSVGGFNSSTSDSQGTASLVVITSLTGHGRGDQEGVIMLFQTGSRC